MRYIVLIASLLAVAPFGCAKGGGSTPSDGLSAALHGARPVAPVQVPVFRAIATDGTSRSEADLRGHPSVVWFYPAADTPG